MSEKILLFIPAYNCEKQIGRVLGQLDGEVLTYIDEVMVVNNRSTDNTEKEVLSFMDRHPKLPVKLVRNTENYGLGGSQKMSFLYACEHGFDYVCMLHGDDQGDIHDFLPMFKKGIHKRHDCVLGARFMRGSKLKGYSRFRTFGNIVYDFIFAFVTRQRIFDLGSGLNLYKTSMLKDKFFFKFPDNLMFNYVMILASHYYKHDIIFYPVSWREEDQVSNVKMMNQALTVLKMAKEYFFDHETIKKEYRETVREAYTCEKITEAEE
ncbi:MAG: glycosyltransferase family 2 protein [Lachnospiraceae bacterium]|jgi:glycosyltransferase involved in cell wall biosynthesis|nr:glycosyltransferase family 2 protein [Lachnospiraceae bacterium]